MAVGHGGASEHWGFTPREDPGGHVHVAHPSDGAPSSASCSTCCTAMLALLSPPFWGGRVPESLWLSPVGLRDTGGLVKRLGGNG